MACVDVTDADREELREFIIAHWFDERIMSCGKVHVPHRGQGILVRRDGRIVAALTYEMTAQGMEVLTLNSALEGQGIGSMLMLSAIETARRAECGRIWLTTSNDNLKAVSFYQRLGFRIVSVNLDMVDEERRMNPRIPTHGERGVRMRDELVLELVLEPYLERST